MYKNAFLVSAQNVYVIMFDLERLLVCHVLHVQMANVLFATTDEHFKFRCIISNVFVHKLCRLMPDVT